MIMMEVQSRKPAFPHPCRPPGRWFSRFFCFTAGLIVVSAGFLLNEHLGSHDHNAAQRQPRVLPAEMRRIMDLGERFVLLSLQPAHEYISKHRAEPAGEMFHGCPVLGKTEIRDKVTRARLLDALNQGIGASAGLYAMCFNPHHGISVTRGNETVDLVICLSACRSGLTGKRRVWF